MSSDQPATRGEPGGHLALYYFPECPYCRRVLDALDRLGLEVELRNILTDRAAWDELIAARGRRTVPVLRIDAQGAEPRWMPESDDIVRWLESTYG